MDTLTDLERRTLGNLPRYRDPDEPITVIDVIDDEEVQTVMSLEDHLREANGYDTDWTLPRATITSTKLAEALTKDKATVSTSGEDLALSAEDVDDTLDALAERGLARLTGDGWAMTPEGLQALEADVEAPDVPEGPAVIGQQPVAPTTTVLQEV